MQRNGLWLVMAFMLIGCGRQDEQEDLRQYVKDINTQVKKTSAALMEVRQAVPVTYQSQKGRDPFVLAVTDTQQSRPKMPLEAFPLANLSFVGIIQHGDMRFATVVAPDQRLYRIQVGDYIGERGAQVVEIGSHYLKIAESVVGENGKPSQRYLMMELHARVDAKEEATANAK